MTTILKVDPVNPSRDILRYAAEVLRNNGIVAFPTETVYGLGGNVYSETAARKIFQAKNRPIDNPLIIHISDQDMLEEVAVNIPEKAYRLIKVFWPGPLTLILPRNPRIPPIVSSYLDTVAVRMPAHPVAIGLIRELGSPIAAPSANLAGKPSPTSAEHVIRDLSGRVDLIIDGGETIHGIESTIINILEEPPILLRPGAYPVEEIERVLGEKIIIPDFARGVREAEKAIAPGMRYRHYAPDTPIVLIDPVSGNETNTIDALIKAYEEYRRKGYKICVVATRETISRYRHILENTVLLEIGSRGNLFEIARNLFKTLRLIDESRCDIGIVEGIREQGLGLAIMNRLRKASKYRIIV